MPFILSLAFLTGVSLLVYGSFVLKKPEEEIIKDVETLNMIKQSVEDADITLSNINSVSSLIIDEIDIKYKELLFLYQMLDEKKKEILEYTTNVEKNIVNNDEAEQNTYLVSDDDKMQTVFETNLEIMEIGMKMDEARQFPKLKNRETILEMYDSGRGISDIARDLSIGKGEVQLIIGLSKVGVGVE